eukprot:15480993-Alexandrium_andersonii.AAC.1
MQLCSGSTSSFTAIQTKGQGFGHDDTMLSNLWSRERADTAADSSSPLEPAVSIRSNPTLGRVKMRPEVPKIQGHIDPDALFAPSPDGQRAPGALGARCDARF